MQTYTKGILAAFRPLFEACGEVLERFAQVGNGTAEYRQQQSAKLFTRRKLRGAISLWFQGEGTFPLKQAQRHAACPGHRFVGHKVGNGNGKGLIWA